MAQIIAPVPKPNAISQNSQGSPRNAAEIAAAIMPPPKQSAPAPTSQMRM